MIGDFVATIENRRASELIIGDPGKTIEYHRGYDILRAHWGDLTAYELF